MIEINSLQSEAFDGDFYRIRYERLGFLLFPSPDLSFLKAFNSTNQKNLGKTFIRFNLTSLLKYPTFFKQINYVLLTDYKEILCLPYLLRMAPETYIIATSLAYQLARITLYAFQDALAEYDSTSEMMDFEKEGEILGQYQEQLSADFEDWRRLYSKQQVQNTLKRVIKVNYHQIFNTQRGVQLRAFPSGKNNGSCCWQLLGTLAGEKILLINQICQYNWRTCRPFDLGRVKESHEQGAYQFVIFTKKALEAKEGQEAKLAETVKKINNNAENGISTTVVLQDDSLCVDLIPRLSTIPEGKICGILLKQNSYHFFHNVINSYVDYLSEHYRNQVFCQNPDYPLAHYTKLKEKRLLLIGSLEQAAVKDKLPLRQVISRCHPFVQFMSSYQFHLLNEQLSTSFANIKHLYEEIKLNSNFTTTMLNNLISCTPAAKMLGFSQGFANIDVLKFGKKYAIGAQKRQVYHIKAINRNNQEYQKFVLANNQLCLEEAQLRLVKVSTNWAELLAKDLTSRGFKVYEVAKDAIKTKRTIVLLSQQYKLQIVSSDGEELIAIEKWFRERGAKYILP